MYVYICMFVLISLTHISPRPVPTLCPICHKKQTDPRALKSHIPRNHMLAYDITGGWFPVPRIYTTIVCSLAFECFCCSSGPAIYHAFRADVLAQVRCPISGCAEPYGDTERLRDHLCNLHRFPKETAVIVHSESACMRSITPDGLYPHAFQAS